MIKRFLFLIILICCQNLIAEERPIVILYSDDNQHYQTPAQLFKEKQTRQVIEFNLHGNVDLAPEILDEIIQKKPVLIFALGAKAAWFAKIATKQHQEIKVLFAMVINWQRHDLLDGQANIIGISYDISPGTQLFNLSLIAPNTKRVGVIYSEKFSTEIIKKAESAARLLGIELVTQIINRADAFRRGWRKISANIDAYWVLTDPILYTMENIHWLNGRCLKEKIVCIGQSTNITKLGVLLSISPDNDNIGLEAVALAKRFLAQDLAKGTRRAFDPIGTTVTFNSHTAKKIGLNVSAQVLLMVNHVITE